MPIIGVYGWDTANLAWVKMLVDSLGHVQVDVLTSALPTDAATETTLDLVRAELDGIEGLLAGGLPSELDTDSLKVREQNWPATYPLSAAQIASLQAVTVGNFPATYPLSAAQIASLQQVTEQGTPTVHCQGWDGSAWQNLLTESASRCALQVAISHAGNIASVIKGDAAPGVGDYGLFTEAYLQAWDYTAGAFKGQASATVADGQANRRGLYVNTQLLGYNGTTWDRLRTYGTGILKVGRAEVGLSNSGVLSGDTSVKASAGNVYWITVSDTAALAIELNDSTDNSGTDLWGIDLPAGGYIHLIFDPPIEFATGIYLDVSTATCKVTIGYL